VANCAGCQRYFAAADQLDAQLRRGSLRTAHAVPADLEARICRAIEPTVSASRRHARHSGPRLVWLGVAASSVVAAVIVVQLHQPVTRGTDSLVIETKVKEEPATKGVSGSSFEPLSIPAWSTLLPNVATLTEENPLRREIDAVESDTRAALRFLARNFLPTSAEAGVVPAGVSRSSS
jgi:hypothetical protein